MTALATMEWRLLRREPLVLIFGFAFPVVLLVVMGLATSGPDKDLGGLRLIEAYVPILIAFNLAMLGVKGACLLEPARDQGRRHEPRII